MSSNQHRSGRVRNLSQHFDSLAQAEDREYVSPSTMTEEPSSPEAPKTVFTGEHRVPLRDRLRAMRKGIHARKEERRSSGLLSDSLESMVSSTSPPRTPSPITSTSTSISTSPCTPANNTLTRRRSRPAALPLGACPHAPRKANKYLAVHLDASPKDSSSDDDDCLFDRRATQHAEAVSKRLFVDQATDRHRRRVTAPGAPSPLRTSYNADEMAKLAAELDVMRAEIAAREKEESAGTDDERGPQPFVKGFARFVR
ncbi:hypothetical protein F4781DRAFT_442038 [Annulohypoxylon bovei var. microspora]|nr:hypothetical protein F4781DRAFT_442038 [Annulohypoxylon bovei var. microspora]